MGRLLDPEALLALWERALRQPAVARDDALLQGLSEAVAVPSALGERNVRLLGLHTQLFGCELALLSRCPACKTAAQFGADCEELAKQGLMPPEASLVHRLEVCGYSIQFRLPESADVHAASGGADDDDFAMDLLGRCVLACASDGVQVPARDLPAPVLHALSERMGALDPAASVSFALTCPECAACWDARLDVGQLLWQKLQAAAERILLDVDALARVYGWTETEVLRLSPTRRAAYLQLVGA
jgi:hypothetical protein